MVFASIGIGRTAAADQADALTITLRLRDTARVPGDVLSEAQAEVTRIYRQAHVETLWLSAESLSAQSTAVRQATMTVAIVPLDQAERLNSTVVRGGVGFSLRSATEGGRVAYVVYDRVQELTGVGNGLKRAQVLAIVIAHEIGHLLLPYNAHSETGLMRADWTMTDLRLAQRSRMLFTAEQCELLRSRISASRQQ